MNLLEKKIHSKLLCKALNLESQKDIGLHIMTLSEATKIEGREEADKAHLLSLCNCFLKSTFATA